MLMLKKPVTSQATFVEWGIDLDEENHQYLGGLYLWKYWILVK